MERLGALTGEQSDKLIEFQELTGIEDVSVCRDVLQRHRWDLEVAVQEQLNIREGRPSVFATEARPPPVVRDHIAQQVFEPPEEPDGSPVLTRLFSFFVGAVLSVCSFVVSIPTLIFTALRGDDRRIVTDPLGDVMAFIDTFTARYVPHPVFYRGTYSQALNDAKQELRFLLVYLHDEDAADTHRFCSRTLSDANVVRFLDHSALFWGCSVRSPEGYRVAQSVAARRYPLLCVVALRDHKMTILARIEGMCPPDLLLKRLDRVFGDNEIHLARARADRLERSLNATLRAQQDEAYEESLRADREKERRRREADEEEARLRKSESDSVAREERRRADLVNSKKEMATRLPEEPSAAEPDVLSFLFKLPCGARLERRFSGSDTLEDIYNFVFSHPLSPEEFELMTNFPKRILTSSGKPKSLIELGLKNRDVLFVNDCNA